MSMAASPPRRSWGLLRYFHTTLALTVLLATSGQEEGGGAPAMVQRSGETSRASGDAPIHAPVHTGPGAKYDGGAAAGGGWIVLESYHAMRLHVKMPRVGLSEASPIKPTETRGSASTTRESMAAVAAAAASEQASVELATDSGGPRLVVNASIAVDSDAEAQAGARNGARGSFSYVLTLKDMEIVPEGVSCIKLLVNTRHYLQRHRQHHRRRHHHHHCGRRRQQLSQSAPLCQPHQPQVHFH